MAVVSNDLFNSYKYYFSTLENLGYVKEGDLNKLIIYSFIEELLEGPYSVFITDEDYNSIDKALNCLYGSSCLVPFPKYTNEDSIYGYFYNDGGIYVKLTENSDERYTEASEIRYHN